ncbi:FKBP-type peptidyl-prolyl cis-trans isomerase [Microbacterium flavum]|uniref:Peptidylprolyl isomerase n=1 Tax=Microbacterium flavum TaxID=415216 RepID=A0ABS5XVK5_9MICO|nr:peptidylprolyl isomerase [Microbacterium flavum]MBT8798557.1 peptidylprolyl isomerase [Microbacterium flavum]
MHRIPAVLAVLGLSALTLAACAAGPAEATCERTDSSSSVFDVIHASGDFGTPQVKIDAPITVDATQHVDETVGDGTRLTTDAQDVIFSVSILSGASGQQVAGGATPPQALTDWRENYAGLADAMMCATEGSRILATIPASGLSEQAAQSWGVGADQSIVVAIDLTKVYLAAADGASQYNDRPGMPSVVVAPGGRPGIIVPDAAAPEELVTETLLKGTGPEITADDTARVQFTAVDWATRKVTKSTWEDGASVPITSQSRVPFAAELVGATVGSQLLVVVPADGAGSAASVYVVDILGIDPPAAAAGTR